MGLSTNFSFRRFDLFVGPPLHRLASEKPHLLEKTLFGRVGLLEISFRILYGADYRYESISKLRVRAEKRQQSLVTHFPCRHPLNLPRFSNRQDTPHHFESHPLRGPKQDSLAICRRGYLGSRITSRLRLEQAVIFSRPITSLAPGDSMLAPVPSATLSALQIASTTLGPNDKVLGRCDESHEPSPYQIR